MDATRFVKLFLDGMKQAAGLSKAGMAVFELVYRQLQENANSDEKGLAAADRGESSPDTIGSIAWTPVDRRYRSV